MTFRSGKQKFTKEEIIDILKRNVNLFKDEEEFVQYIVDLATYLIEHRLYSSGELHKKEPEPGNIEKRTEQFSRQRDRDEEAYNVLKKYSTKQEEKQVECRMCGAPTQGKSICPVCGNMSF